MSVRLVGSVGCAFLVAYVFFPMFCQGVLELAWPTVTAAVSFGVAAASPVLAWFLLFLCWERCFGQALVWENMGVCAPDGVVELFRWLCIGLVGLVILLVLLNLLGHFFPEIDRHHSYQFIADGTLGLSQAQLGWLGVFVIGLGPVVEELVFRGLLQTVLMQQYGVLLGSLWTIVLFTLMHADYHHASLAQYTVLVLGAWLSVLRVFSGQIWPGMLVHLGNNGLAFLLLASS